MTARMSLILFWVEVEEEENDDENSIFPALMKMEEGEEEEESLFSGLMKMESDEEEQKETFVFSGVMAPDEEGSDLCWELVSDHRGQAKTRSRRKGPWIWSLMLPKWTNRKEKGHSVAVLPP